MVHKHKDDLGVRRQAWGVCRSVVWTFYMFSAAVQGTDKQLLLRQWAVGDTLAREAGDGAHGIIYTRSYIARKLQANLKLMNQI